MGIVAWKPTSASNLWMAHNNPANKWWRSPHIRVLARVIAHFCQRKPNPSHGRIPAAGGKRGRVAGGGRHVATNFGCSTASASTTGALCSGSSTAATLSCYTPSNKMQRCVFEGPTGPDESTRTASWHGRPRGLEDASSRGNRTIRGNENRKICEPPPS